LIAIAQTNVLRVDQEADIDRDVAHHLSRSRERHNIDIARTRSIVFGVVDGVGRLSEGMGVSG
jgi:hypothetical protein